MTKRIFAATAAGMALIAVCFAYAPVSRFFAVDNCLDSGGFWNYEQGKCECSYADTGYYLSKPKAQHLEERNRCDDLMRARIDSEASGRKPERHVGFQR